MSEYAGMIIEQLQAELEKLKNVPTVLYYELIEVVSLKEYKRRLALGEVPPFEEGPTLADCNCGNDDSRFAKNRRLTYGEDK
jgi:hypothetical protein